MNYAPRQFSGNNLISFDDCKHGLFFTLKGDVVVGESLRRYGEWAEAEIRLFSMLVRPGDIIVEAGANIGAHTVPLSAMAGEGGTVYAFEPFHFNHKLLCANLLVNSCNNARTYQASLGSEQRFVALPDLDASLNNNFGAIGHYLDVPTLPRRPMNPEITIDSLNLDRLAFLKIDVEGHERAVLSGAMSTITKNRPIVFVESLNHYALQLAEDGHRSWVIEQLKPLGYRFWHYITPVFNSTNSRGAVENIFGGQWSFDLICLHRDTGIMTGLPDAEIDAMHCSDPDQWRGVNLIRANAV